jgi:dihydroorotase
VKLTIRKPDDFHVHLRGGEMLKHVLPFTAARFGRALVMPNLSPPIITPDEMRAYRDAIRHNAKESGYPEFEPLMTFYIGADTTADSISHFKTQGATAGKLYPKGVTTGSEAGAESLDALYKVFEKMEKYDIPLCVHGETDDFCMDREEKFLKVLFKIISEFGSLRVVLEHITTAAGVRFVRDGHDLSRKGRLAGTITPHHLVLTLDDIIGGTLDPHAFCKPVAKRPEDRGALIDACTNGEPYFFLGTDSAPHTHQAKHMDGCAGIFNTPTALEVLAEVFEEHGALHRLEDFTSRFGAEFYGLPLNEDELLLAKESWTPPEYAWGGGLVPTSVLTFRGGTELAWKVMFK